MYRIFTSDAMLQRAATIIISNINWLLQLKSGSNHHIIPSHRRLVETDMLCWHSRDGEETVYQCDTTDQITWLRLIKNWRLWTCDPDWSVPCKACRNLMHWSSDVSRSSKDHPVNCMAISSNSHKMVEAIQYGLHIYVSSNKARIGNQIQRTVWSRDRWRHGSRPGYI